MVERIDALVADRISSMADLMEDATLWRRNREDPGNDSSDDDDDRVKPKGVPNAAKIGSLPIGREKGVTPLRRRQTMLPGEVEIFENNPTIAGLGLDTMAGKGDQASSVDWTVERTRRMNQGPKAAIPAKKTAIKPKPFDGTLPWKKWYNRFCNDMATNGWDETQIKGSLIECLRDGPGDDALWTFEENGDGTLRCLVTTAAWICGPMDGADPAVELESRRQQKGESFRKFGLTLRRLAKEAFEGLSPSEPWLVRKVSGLFIDGLEDEDMSRELAYRWSTDMSLNDLFTIAEDIKRKKILLRTPAVPVATSTVKVCTATEGGWDTISVVSDPDSGGIAAMETTSGRGGFRGRGRGIGRIRKEGRPGKDGTLSPDLMQAIEKMVERLCGHKEEKKASGPTASGMGSHKEGRSKANAPCFVCRKTGHWARECPERTAAALEDGSPLEEEGDDKGQQESGN